MLSRRASSDVVLPNMSAAERILAISAGTLLAAYGVRRRDPAGWLMAIAGGGVALQGASGHSILYARLGIHRHEGARGAANVVRGKAVHVESSITIDRPIHEVYRFWRQFENLPRFTNHLVRVVPLGPNLYRWFARGPLGTVEWDAEVIEEQSPWFISWRSLPGTGIHNAGSVYFSPAPGWQGTEVRVSMVYQPPAGVIGAMFARVTGKEPSQQVPDDLERLKALLESGAASNLPA